MAQQIYTEHIYQFNSAEVVLKHKSCMLHALTPVKHAIKPILTCLYQNKSEQSIVSLNLQRITVPVLNFIFLSLPNT